MSCANQAAASCRVTGFDFGTAPIVVLERDEAIFLAPRFFEAAEGIAESAVVADAADKAARSQPKSWSHGSRISDEARTLWIRRKAWWPRRYCRSTAAPSGGKASRDYVDAELSRKADRDYVDSALLWKANRTTTRIDKGW